MSAVWNLSVFGLDFDTLDRPISPTLNYDFQLLLRDGTKRESDSHTAWPAQPGQFESIQLRIIARQNVLFRFTIGSLNPATCKLWEPGAPSPQERLAALQHAHQQGYGTSVSMEPMLEDTAQMVAAVGTLEPFVTDTIWLGKLNGGIPRSRQTPAVAAALAQLRAAQSDAEILRLVAMLQTHHKVRWKDSITEVLRETPAPGAP